MDIRIDEVLFRNLLRYVEVASRFQAPVYCTKCWSQASGTAQECFVSDWTVPVKLALRDAFEAACHRGESLAIGAVQAKQDAFGRQAVEIRIDGVLFRNLLRYVEMASYCQDPVYCTRCHSEMLGGAWQKWKLQEWTIPVKLALRDAFKSACDSDKPCDVAGVGEAGKLGCVVTFVGLGADHNAADDQFAAIREPEDRGAADAAHRVGRNQERVLTEPGTDVAAKKTRRPRLDEWEPMKTDILAGDKHAAGREYEVWLYRHFGIELPS